MAHWPTYRLTRSVDFQHVRTEGRSWSDRLLVLYKTANGLPHSRFGFSVSRRVGKAVVRNRARRLMREAVRLQCERIAPGWDVLWVARRGIVGTDYWAVARSVSHLLGLAHLYRPAHPTEVEAKG